MTRAPDWSDEEFRLLLSQPDSPAEELADNLPLRSAEAIQVVREGVSEFRRTGSSSLLSRTMVRILTAVNEPQVRQEECVCCEHNAPTQGRRICPLCGHQFQGNGWDGIDAHWRARHEAVMSYERFWQSLCVAHRG